MSSSKNLELKKTAFLSKSNSAFIDEMYMKYVNNDPDLPESWKRYFNEIGDDLEVIVKEINGPSWSPSKKFPITLTKEENSQNTCWLIKNNINPLQEVERRNTCRFFSSRAPLRLY